MYNINSETSSFVLSFVIIIGLLVVEDATASTKKLEMAGGVTSQVRALQVTTG